MNYIQYMWTLLFVVLIIIELTTSMLVSIWFAIAALIVFFISYIIQNIYLQFLIFSVISLLLFYISKDIKKKFLNKETNFNSNFIGSKVTIIKKEKDRYVVKFKSSDWNALSFDKEYEVGDVALIKEFQGNKIII